MSNNTKPRITAEWEIDSRDIAGWVASEMAATPYVRIEVEFDLGDEALAQASLDEAVAKVEKKIKMTRRAVRDGNAPAET